MKSPVFLWILKTAIRDAIAGRRKLTLMIASIILGITAVVSILSFGESLSRNISDQSKGLVGADFVISSGKPAEDSLKSIIDSLGGADARECTFASMVYFPENGSSRLVQVKALEGSFPFYGEVETSPVNAFQLFRKTESALVDATVMLQYGLNPGDSVRIGNVKLVIAGALNRIPGQSGIGATIAPPVYIPYRLLSQSGLLQKGSRIEYRYYFNAPETDPEKLEKSLKVRLETLKADLDTHKSRAESLGKNYENVGRFLNIVAFIALLLGCVGVASAVHVYVRDKVSTVAVLRCIGATRLQTFLIYLLQVTFIGIAASAVGVIAGTLIQQIFPVLFRDFLPVNLNLLISWRAIAIGATLGIFMALLFAMLPLFSVWNTSPLNVLRITDERRSVFQPYRLIVSAAIILFLFFFSYLLTGNWSYAAGFIAGVLVVFFLLAGLAFLSMKLLRRYFPDDWSFTTRQSLSNLYRPGNQTLILIVSIGLGTFLISTLYFTQEMLLKKVSLQQTASDPNIIIFDIQSDQKENLKSMVKHQGLPVLQELPIVTMRFQAIRGVDVSQIIADSTSEIKDWIIKREFRVTFRDSLTDTESLEDGTWIGKVKDLSQPVPVSVDKGLAEGMQAHVGDRLVFNVQGVSMETYIASIRKVDWARLQTNFAIVFPEGVLESAPQFHVVTTRVPDDESSARLQKALVSQFPNIAVIDLKQAFITIQDILSKISWVINFMAFFSILTGIVVLTGAVRTSKYQRIKESVLLRTLGAKEKQILKINALEYFFLGSLSGFTGILLSAVSSLLLGLLVFEVPFSASLIPVLIIFAGITCITVLVGYLNSRSIVKSPPLEVLRREV
jgi:putative ABC transport system permease protein